MAFGLLQRGDRLPPVAVAGLQREQRPGQSGFIPAGGKGGTPGLQRGFIITGLSPQAHGPGMAKPGGGPVIGELAKKTAGGFGIALEGGDLGIQQAGEGIAPGQSAGAAGVFGGFVLIADCRRNQPQRQGLLAFLLTAIADTATEPPRQPRQKRKQAIHHDHQKNDGCHHRDQQAGLNLNPVAKPLDHGLAILTGQETGGIASQQDQDRNRHQTLQHGLFLINPGNLKRITEERPP